MADDAQMREGLPRGHELLRCGIVRPVIDIDDLVRMQGRTGCLDFLDQRQDIARLILHGHHNAQVERRIGHGWRRNHVVLSSRSSLRRAQ